MPFREFESVAFSRRSLLRGGAWLGAGAAVASVPIGRQGFAQTIAPEWSHIRALEDKYVGTGKLANMVAALGRGQQAPEIIAQGNLAFGSEKRADADSLYRIYSMTKPVTGMAAMMLIDDGRMGLDQPLHEVLPAFRNMRVQKTYDGSLQELEPAERPITMRMLLTHTAGLGYGIVQSGPISRYFMQKGLVPGQVSRLPLPGMGRGKTIEGLDNFADELAKAPLVLQPGTKWSYSVGLDLMGRVIEVVSGMRFDEFLKARIFDPIGMPSTFFRVPQSEIGRFTTNYGILNGTPIPMDPAQASIYLDKPSFPFGGAGLVSSARDYDRFLQMLLGYGAIDGTRVMSEAAVRLGTSNLLPEGATVAGTWIQGQQFGAGGRVTDGAYGWGGAAGTVGLVHFPAGVRATMMTQYMPSEAYPIHDAFPEALRADLAAMQTKAAA